MSKILAVTVSVLALASLATAETEVMVDAPFEYKLSGGITPDGEYFSYSLTIRSLIGSDARAIGFHRLYVEGDQTIEGAFDTYTFNQAGERSRPITGDLDPERIVVCALIHVQQATVSGMAAPDNEGPKTPCLVLRAPVVSLETPPGSIDSESAPGVPMNPDLRR